MGAVSRLAGRLLVLTVAVVLELLELLTVRAVLGAAVAERRSATLFCARIVGGRGAGASLADTERCAVEAAGAATTGRAEIGLRTVVTRAPFVEEATPLSVGLDLTERSTFGPCCAIVLVDTLAVSGARCTTAAGARTGCMFSSSCHILVSLASGCAALGKSLDAGEGDGRRVDTR